jgi:hypothetical protein
MKNAVNLVDLDEKGPLCRRVFWDANTSMQLTQEGDLVVVDCTSIKSRGDNSREDSER